MSTEPVLRPLFARVLLRREQLKSSSSIIIPDSAQERNAPLRGEVVAIGPAAEGVEPGDIVVFGQHAGKWVTPSGRPPSSSDKDALFICQDEDILCVVEEQNDG